MHFVIARVPPFSFFAMCLDNPVVNHSEQLVSPNPSQESRLNEYDDVGARKGGDRKKDPQTWFANSDASKAAEFCANHSLKSPRLLWASRRRCR
jgi:hypothetical protein